MTPERWHEVKRVLGEAMSRDPQARKTYLMGVRARDLELFEQVRALLAYDSSDSFLEHPVVPGLTMTKGTMLGDYEVQEPLGAGGMGVVYLALDRSLDRRVALKILPEELQRSDTARRRFLREARAAAALDHPYICKIYETREAEGRRFIAMEYVPGETLASRLKCDALPLDQALRIAVEVAEALELAHGKGVVHRDLKPSNIMLTVGGHVKVLDFGLAKRLAIGGDDDAETASELTEAGTTMGTVAYMAPEQVRGEAMDARSDIFSFGVLLYEMVGGIHPFRRNSKLETGAAILNDAPPSVAHHRAQLPPLLEHIVDKMLAKAPDDRYQSVREIRTDLGRARSGPDRTSDVVVEAGAPGAREQVERQPGSTAGQAGSTDSWLDAATSGLRSSVDSMRRRSRLATAAVGLVVLALVAIGAWWARSEPGRAPDRARLSVAVLPLSNLSVDARESDYLADGITRSVITRLTQAGLRVTPWESVMRLRQNRGPSEQVARDLSVEAVLVGTFQLRDDRILTTLSLIEEDGFQSWADEFEERYEDLFTVQRRIAEGAAASLKRELTGEEEIALAASESGSVEAYDVYLQGAHLMQEGDRESTDVAFQYFTRAVELDPDLAEAHVGLGAVYTARWVSAWGGSEVNLDLAESSYSAALRADPSSIGARRGLAHVSYAVGQSEASLLQGQEAARVGRPDDIESLLARAESFMLAGLGNVALPLFQHIITLDPLNEPSYWYATFSAILSDDFEAAIELGNEYLLRFGDDAMVHTNLAMAYFLRDDRERATQHFDQATALQGPASAENPSYASLYAVRALTVAGGFYDRIGRRDRAEAMWRRGIGLVRQSLQIDPENRPFRLYLAALHAFLGQRDEFEVERDRLSTGGSTSEPEVIILVGGIAAMGDIERASELLLSSLRAGRVPFWKAYLPFLAPTLLDAPSFEVFRQEYEAVTERLRARYAPMLTSS